VNFRAPIAVVLCALLVSCGRDGNPFASFDTRCAKLPAPRVDVVIAPVSFDRDDTRAIAELTVKSGSALATHRTMGLTTAMFGQSTDIDLHVVDDRRGSRACGTPTVRVELSMQPMTVFIAREVAETPCQREATLQHEMKHVEVFREVLDEAAGELEREFPDAIGAELRRAANAAELQQRLILSVRDYLAQFMKDWQRVLDARQREVDSPEEYARVAAACGFAQ
jgi:hypothetical protein